MARDIPGRGAFIDAARYDALFNPALPLETLDANTSAVTFELYLKYLPYSLLAARCDELAKGSEQPLIDYVGGYYSADQLTALKLRERLDAKLPSVGGCPVTG